MNRNGRLDPPGTGPGNEDESPEELERQTGRTRVELGRTLEAIERQLAARHLVEKGLDMLNETMGGYEGITRVVRDNPVPCALIGLGAAWLVASNTGVIDRIAQNEQLGAATRKVGDMASNVATSVTGRITGGNGSDDAMGRTGNSMVDQGGNGSSGGWVHSVADAAQGALRSARDSSGAVLSKAGDYAGDGYGRVADQIADTFSRNPLIVGAVGVMAGALLAALLPSTRVEGEWFGETRDELLQRATDAGQQAVSQVREAAVRAVEAAGEAATEAAKDDGKSTSFSA